MVGLSSGIEIILSNSVDSYPIGPRQGVKALMLGGERFLVHISIERIQSGLARLLDKKWFVGVIATTTTFYVDLGW